MSWKERMKEYGGGDLAFLSEDGEVIRFIVVGEPELLESTYKGSPTRKIGCPIMTEDGYMLFVAGMRLARKLSKHEDSFNVAAFMAVRHGERNNANAVYDLIVLEDVELTKKLFKMKKTSFDEVMIAESVKAAKDVMAKS